MQPLLQWKSMNITESKRVYL